MSIEAHIKRHIVLRTCRANQRGKRAQRNLDWVNSSLFPVYWFMGPHAGLLRGEMNQWTGYNGDLTQSGWAESAFRYSTPSCNSPSCDQQQFRQPTGSTRAQVCCALVVVRLGLSELLIALGLLAYGVLPQQYILHQAPISAGAPSLLGTAHWSLHCKMFLRSFFHRCNNNQL